MIESNHNLDQDYIRSSQQQDESPHHIDEVGKDIDISPLLFLPQRCLAVFVAIIIITLMMVALV